MGNLKKTIRVTIEKTIQVELTPAMFGGMSEADYLAEFRKSLWHVGSLDDVFMYAARAAATGGIGREHDGLGLLKARQALYPRTGDVLAEEVDTHIDCHIMPETEPR